MTVNFRGYVFNDAGTAVSGASVKLLETGTTTQEGSTVTTDSNGLWYFNEADQDRYDVEITSGTSVRRIRWNDEISLKEIDVRNNAAAGTPAGTFTNLTNSAANQVAVFSGANSTKADNDEIYLSFKLADSAGNIDEFARMTIVATDVTSGSEDGQIEFDVIKAGTLTKVWTITSSDAAAMSFDMNVDALTIGSGADTDVSLTFDANSADGVITWMEDEDYFQFSDDILMSTTERINLRDTAIYIYSSADGQLDLVADTEIQIAATTIDINGAVALNGAITGATNITLSGELDAATLDISGNADIDGTTNLDAVDIDGAVQIDGTVTVGVDDTGHDVKFFGATASAYLLWDESADKLLTAGAAAVDIVKDKLLIGGTAVTTTAAELNVLDAVSAGTVTASLGVVVDSNKDIGTFRNITLSGELDAGSLDVSGAADIDGLTNLDAVDIDGAVQIDSTVTVGVDDTGYDVKFFGATSGAYMLWDESTDDLVLAGAANLYFYDAGGGEKISSDGTDFTFNSGNDFVFVAGGNEFKYQVAGETLVRIQDTSNSVTTTIIAGTSAGAIGTSTAHPFQIWQGGDNRLAISSNGATWAFQQATTINTSAGALTLGPANASLLFTGTLAVTGSRVTQSYHTNLTSTNAVTVDSSETVKRNIEDYENDALSIVRDMSVVTYDHDEWLDDSESKRLGVIAESVQEPLALDEIERPDGTKYPGINTYGLETLLVRAMQQIDKRLEKAGI
jgi:cytoskeletal protein CcmA (bactofilin family)